VSSFLLSKKVSSTLSTSTPPKKRSHPEPVARPLAQRAKPPGHHQGPQQRKEHRSSPRPGRRRRGSEVGKRADAEPLPLLKHRPQGQVDAVLVGARRRSRGWRSPSGGLGAGGGGGGGLVGNFDGLFDDGIAEGAHRRFHCLRNFRKLILWKFTVRIVPIERVKGKRRSKRPTKRR